MVYIEAVKCWSNSEFMANAVNEMCERFAYVSRFIRLDLKFSFSDNLIYIAVN